MCKRLCKNSLSLKQDQTGHYILENIVKEKDLVFWNRGSTILLGWITNKGIGIILVHQSYFIIFGY